MSESPIMRSSPLNEYAGIEYMRLAHFQKILAFEKYGNLRLLASRMDSSESTTGFACWGGDMSHS